MKEKIKIFKTLDINLFNKSYIQLNTNKGIILINNQKEADDFLNTYEVLK